MNTKTFYHRKTPLHKIENGYYENWKVNQTILFSRRTIFSASICVIFSGITNSCCRCSRSLSRIVLISSLAILTHTSLILPVSVAYAIFSLAMFTYSLSMSIPMKLRPSCTAAIAVVPAPINGSRITSPASVVIKISRSSSGIGS